MSCQNNTVPDRKSTLLGVRYSIKNRINPIQHEMSKKISFLATTGSPAHAHIWEKLEINPTI